jgi:hypothetical protein
LRDAKHHNRRKHDGTKVVPYCFYNLLEEHYEKNTGICHLKGTELPELVVESGGHKKTYGKMVQRPTRAAIKMEGAKCGWLGRTAGVFWCLSLAIATLRHQR